jgi:hypothetical protein
MCYRKMQGTAFPSENLLNIIAIKSCSAIGSLYIFATFCHLLTDLFTWSIIFNSRSLLSLKNSTTSRGHSELGNSHK